MFNVPLVFSSSICAGFTVSKKIKNKHVSRFREYSLLRDRSLWKGRVFFLNFRQASLPLVYLGPPVGANPRRVDTWEPLVEQIR